MKFLVVHTYSICIVRFSGQEYLNITNHTGLVNIISSKISLWPNCQEKYPLKIPYINIPPHPTPSWSPACISLVHTCTVVGEAILLSAVDILLKHWKLECNWWNFGILCPQGVVCIALTPSTVLLISIWIVLSFHSSNMAAFTVSRVIFGLGDAKLKEILFLFMWHLKFSLCSQNKLHKYNQFYQWLWSAKSSLFSKYFSLCF